MTKCHSEGGWLGSFDAVCKSGIARLLSLFERARLLGCAIVVFWSAFAVAVAFELAVDGARGDAEQLRGEALVSSRVTEGLLDHPQLDVLERRADLERERTAADDRTFARQPTHLPREIVDVDEVRLG